ncbi:MAG TPA: universal stress protein [Kofleriaceae bacterium]|nr:universal stress protein [Kofleriaceae bacterium]
MSIIAVATDFSPQAEVAFARALALAAARGAELLVISADTTVDLVPTTPEPEVAVPTWNQLRTDVETEEKRLLDELLRRAAAAGVASRAVRAIGDPAELTVKAAREHGAELIVVGSHGRTGIRRFLLGSIAERIVEHASSSVLVARGDGSAPFAKVLVATDFGPQSAPALAQAQALAPGAQVILVNAWHYPAGAWSLAALGERTHASEALEAALTEPPRARGLALVAEEAAAGRTVEFVQRQGQPAEVVTDLATAEHADLVALGTHGRHGVRRILLGSVANAIVRHAPCSVLVVRDTAAPAAVPAPEAPPSPDGPVTA